MWLWLHDGRRPSWSGRWTCLDEEASSAWCAESNAIPLRAQGMFHSVKFSCGVSVPPEASALIIFNFFFSFFALLTLAFFLIPLLLPHHHPPTYNTWPHPPTLPKARKDHPNLRTFLFLPSNRMQRARSTMRVNVLHGHFLPRLLVLLFAGRHRDQKKEH